MSAVAQTPGVGRNANPCRAGAAANLGFQGLEGGVSRVIVRLELLFPDLDGALMLDDLKRPGLVSFESVDLDLERVPSVALRAFRSKKRARQGFHADRRIAHRNVPKSRTILIVTLADF